MLKAPHSVLSLILAAGIVPAAAMPMTAAAAAMPLTAAAAIPLTSAAATDSGDGYALNFDASAARTRTDRVLNAISLGGQAIDVAAPAMMYNDLRASHFYVRPGQTVTPVFAYSGAWMQGYVYVDWDRNGRFDAQTPGAQGRLDADNELVSYAGMGLPDGNFNSAGERLADLNAIEPPSFTVPDWVEPGQYVMRWKVDWNDSDPGGRMDEANSIIRNGGAIVDVVLEVCSEMPDGEYELVFADEFDLPDGSTPDPARWQASARRSSVWNRWTSDSPLVAFIEGGNLVCRAIPNPDPSADDVPMLTGAVETRDLYAFTYGKVEVRLRTQPFSGNFPAAWMMPQPPCESWPSAGEIDIFEAIDAQNTSYHTIHSHWTYDLGRKNAPASSFTKTVNMSAWHVYGLEWTADRLIFTVDGETAGTYARSTDDSVLSQGQWPFTHPFYIILNQSVGNGSWAKAADTSHTYETRFDCVRVYQPHNAGNGIAAPSLATPDGRTAQPDMLYDLSGRSYPLSTASPLPHGIYVCRGRKVVR